VMAAPGNAEAIEAWNTVLFDKFVRHREVLVAGLGAHGARALALHPPAPGERVVDIGCGFGDTTIELARRVGANGRAVGVDAAARFIDSARADAARAGATNATFEVADVEAGVPGGPYDRAFSRMGTMFFASPVIALRNIRKALRSDGALCIVVWRKKDANEYLCAPELVVRELLGEPEKGDQVTCGPGPFSMASADVVGDQLVAAGFTDIAFARSDIAVQIGRELDNAVQFSLEIGPAGEVVRLAGEAAIARRAEIERAVRGVLEPFAGPGGVRAPSSCWIVTARAP
jgi:ubiquinone/menaquinone biosynthesis C-methylase UbiE